MEKSICSAKPGNDWTPNELNAYTVYQDAATSEMLQIPISSPPRAMTIRLMMLSICSSGL